MQGFTIKKESLLYRYVNSIHSWPEDNVCLFGRQLFTTSIAWIVVAAIASAIMWVLGNTFAWWAAMLVMWSYIVPTDLALIVSSVLGLLAIAVVLCAAGYYYKECREKQGPREPGFVSVWIKAKHDKICVPIRYE